MEKTEIKKPTIQERIASRVTEILDPVEVWLDRYNNNPERFNPETLKLVNQNFYNPDFLHIDMNNPTPEKSALEFFYPKMNPFMTFHKL